MNRRVLASLTLLPLLAGCTSPAAVAVIRSQAAVDDLKRACLEAGPDVGLHLSPSGERLQGFAVESPGDPRASVTLEVSFQKDPSQAELRLLRDSDPPDMAYKRLLDLHRRLVDSFADAVLARDLTAGLVDLELEGVPQRLYLSREPVNRAKCWIYPKDYKGQPGALAALVTDCQAARAALDPGGRTLEVTRTKEEGVALEARGYDPVRQLRTFVAAIRERRQVTIPMGYVLNDLQVFWDEQSSMQLSTR